MLDEPCLEIIGDSIEWSRSGAAWVPLLAFVDSGESTLDLTTGKMIQQDHAIEVPKASLPGRPGAADRLKIGKLPGMVFRPVNVRHAGRFWAFEVERV